MKKILAFFCALLLVFCILTVVPAFSADTDFVVEDGVLVSYVGSDTSVTIPSSVNTIADSAFLNNTTIKSINLNDKVYSIGNKAFYGCTALTSLIGDSAVVYVGALAFVDTPFLENSTKEFVSVGSALICYNGTDTAVTLPSSICSVSPYAFLRNCAITSFKAADNLTSIGEGAFYQCSNLKEVDVTKAVSFIGADAFNGTKWLDSQTDFVTLGDGILISYKGSQKSVTVPSTVLQIGANAFYADRNITSVTIPQSVFSIGARAFMSCSNLADVSLSSGLVMIDEEAFADCTKLVTIKTPRTLSKIGKGAFVNCNKLSTAFIAGNNLAIDYGAFAFCTSLETVLLSEEVGVVGQDVFNNCVKLSSISIPPQVTVINPGSFSGCRELTFVTDKDSFADTALSGAFTASYNRGDSQVNGLVDVLDATAIQMHIAGLYSLPLHNLAFADADFDANVSVLDATYIQLFIAKLL